MKKRSLYILIGSNETKLRLMSRAHAFMAPRNCFHKFLRNSLVLRALDNFCGLMTEIN